MRKKDKEKDIGRAIRQIKKQVNPETPTRQAKNELSKGELLTMDRHEEVIIP